MKPNHLRNAFSRIIGDLAGDSCEVVIRRYHGAPECDEAGKRGEPEYDDERIIPNPLVVEVSGGSEATAEGVQLTGADVRIVCAGRVTVAPGDEIIARGAFHRVLRVEHHWALGVVVATSIWARREV